MSFAPVLNKILDDCAGAMGAALMGRDGIPIEQVRVATDVEPCFGEDIGAAGVEFGRILEEIRKASDALGGGLLSETLVALARFSLLLRVVDEDTFLVVVLAPEANWGKARYRVRRHLLELRELL